MSEEKKEKLVRATVQRGRTIDVPHPTKRRVANHTPEGKAIEIPLIRHFGPGQEVELPAEEVQRFRKQGYLVDPDRQLPPSALQSEHVTETGR